MIHTDKIPVKPIVPVFEVYYKEPKQSINISKYSQPHLFVILVCPRCHTRVEASYDEWCVSKLPGSGLKKFLCKSLLCDGKELVYHKMVEE